MRKDDRKIYREMIEERQKSGMENRDDLVSVIIPVYNAEKYLDRCVESIVKQTYKNLEIILIDDGSRDSSGSKIDGWAEKDHRITVVHKQNTGVSDTRNIGIDRATGTYLTFIDSDDYIEEDYVAVLHKNIVEQNADIVACNFEAVYEEGIEERSYSLIPEDKVIEECVRLFEDSIQCRIYTYLVWGKLYKKAALQGIRFKKQAYSEDALFIREVFTKSPKVSLITYKGYYYYINSSCVTNDKSRRFEKSFGDLNMLWNTWIMCRQMNLDLPYNTLEQMILRTLKGIIGKSLKEVRTLTKEECRLMKDITGKFNEFENKGRHFWYLRPLGGVVRLLSKIKKDSAANKKKIGIVTIYDLGNYGNRLQNYATVRYLSNMGYDAETLIINQNSMKQMAKKAAGFLKIRKKPSKHWNLQQESKEHVEGLSPSERNRYKLFKEFSYRYTNPAKVHYWKEFPWGLRNKYDYFISGSDQVWNPLIGQGVDWEFLSFSKKEKNISWSASFGISEIPEVHRQKFKNYLMNIRNISVREDTAVSIVHELTGKKAELLIDPTMMITSDEWRGLAKSPEIKVPRKYVLAFFLGGQDEQRREQIRALADKNQCEVINLMDEACALLYKTGPAQFIYLIEHADLICTDSFHACVFSILLDKPFYAFNRMGHGESMSSRISSLLSKFELTDRMFNVENIEKNDFGHNYEHVYKILEEERKKTHDFLVKSFGQR